MSDVYVIPGDPPEVRCKQCFGVAGSIGCCQSQHAARVELSTGDILASGCEALVSPVDTTGAQGAGLALAMAKRYPEQARWYREQARRGVTEPGAVYHVLPKAGDDTTSAARWVLERHRAGGEPLVLFATTKAHWSKPSKLQYVTGCLAGLVRAVEELGIESVAIPMLGCGLGGLRPEDVRPLILAAAESMRCRVWVGEMR